MTRQNRHNKTVRCNTTTRCQQCAKHATLRCIKIVPFLAIFFCITDIFITSLIFEKYNIIFINHKLSKILFGNIRILTAKPSRCSCRYQPLHATVSPSTITWLSTLLSTMVGCQANIYLRSVVLSICQYCHVNIVHARASQVLRSAIVSQTFTKFILIIFSSNYIKWSMFLET